MVLEVAGFQDFDMVSEGEAAANTALAGLSISELRTVFSATLVVRLG
jgi:hypothetical protein